MVRPEAVGLVALDRGDEHRNGRGLTAGAALVDYGIGRGDLLLMGAITGLGVGAFPALLLSRSQVSGAFWWALANPPASALGWLVTSYVITRNVKDQFTNFGASGALVFGTADVAPPHSVVPKHRTRSHTMNIQKTPPAPSLSPSSPGYC